MLAWEPWLTNALDPIVSASFLRAFLAPMVGRPKVFSDQDRAECLALFEQGLSRKEVCEKMNETRYCPSIPLLVPQLFTVFIFQEQTG